MYFVYSLLLTLGVLFLSPLFLLRRGKYTEGLRQRMGEVPEIVAAGGSVIWLHCVSVGETQAARPLFRALRLAFPQYAFVVSTTTLTGQRLAQEMFGAEAAAVFYFPFDWAWCVRRTLRRINPSAVLIMETELWPNFLRLCREREIPTIIVNGRLSAQSARGYRRMRFFISRVVNNLSLALMQDEADAQRLEALGLPAARIHISGNMKFDLAPSADETDLAGALSARFQIDETRPLIVAASTHAPEEGVALAAFRLLRETEPAARLLLAPRHPERFHEVMELLDKGGWRWARRTAQAQPQDSRADVILLDTIGELRAVYGLAKLVFVGGSLAPTGGHNVLEPALARTCIITGPHTFNFTAIIKDFLAARALLQLPETAESETPGLLAATWRELLRNEAQRQTLADNARAVLEKNRGATKRTIELLAPLLRHE